MSGPTTSNATILCDFTGHEGPVIGIDVSSCLEGQHSTFASSSEDGTIRLWDSGCKTSVCTLEHPIMQEFRSLMGLVRFHSTEPNRLFAICANRFFEFDLRKNNVLSVFNVIDSDDYFNQSGTDNTHHEQIEDRDDLFNCINNFDIDCMNKRLCFSMDSGKVLVYRIKEGCTLTENHLTMEPLSSKHDTVSSCALFSKAHRNSLFSGGFDCNIIHHSLGYNKTVQTYNMNTMNPKVDNSQLFNPPFITALQLSPTLQQLGFSLGNGQLGAFHIYEKRKKKTLSMYLGKQPIFQLPSHTAGITDFKWLNYKIIDSTPSSAFLLLSSGLDKRLNLNSIIFHSPGQVLHSWILPKKPNQIGMYPIHSPQTIIEHCFLTDISCSIKQILLNTSKQ